MPEPRWDYRLEPPEPVVCCRLAEDDPDHDTQACLAEQEEAAAEKRAEQIRENLRWNHDWDNRW